MVMPLAPKLAPVVQVCEAALAKAPSVDVLQRASSDGLYDVMAVHTRISIAHQEHLRQMGLLDKTYQEMQGRLLQIVADRSVDCAVGASPVVYQAAESKFMDLAGSRISSVLL